jgi:hypothetical protein
VTGLPELKWNTEGAFIGKLAEVMPEPEHEFPFRYFLAVPLLHIDYVNTILIRFSETVHNGNWQSLEAEAVVSAFVHYSFIKSNRSLLFTDLQGTTDVLHATLSDASRIGVLQEDGTTVMFDPQYCTTGGNAAPWDYGKHCIGPFLKNHKCSKYCTYLELAPLVPERPKPRPRLAAATSSDAEHNSTSRACSESVSDALAALIEPTGREHGSARHSSA